MIRILFKADPNSQYRTFVEVHNAHDMGAKLGTWFMRPDGFQELQLSESDFRKATRRNPRECTLITCEGEQAHGSDYCAVHVELDNHANPNDMALD